MREWEIPTATGMEDEPITITKKHSRLLKKMHGDNYIGNVHNEKQKL